MLRKNETIATHVVEQKDLWSAVRRAEPIQQIRRIMRNKQILSKDLAERLGVSEASVSRLLRGQQNLQLDTLYQLADALEESLTISIGNAEESTLAPSCTDNTDSTLVTVLSCDDDKVTDIGVYRSLRSQSRIGTSVRSVYEVCPTSLNSNFKECLDSTQVRSTEYSTLTQAGSADCPALLMSA